MRKYARPIPIWGLDALFATATGCPVRGTLFSPLSEAFQEARMADDVVDPEETTADGTFASPPCYLHEIDPAYAGLIVDPSQARDVARWRKAERQRLIAARLTLPVAAREECAAHVAADLDHLIPFSPSTIVSAYWPFRGEPDLRPWMAAVHARGARIALPIVVGKGMPLVFREWYPRARLEPGIWGIPVPAEGAEVTPTVVIAPLVGFDHHGYRLGYGGGFFDRTLAALDPKAVAIGVGHPIGALPTIYPQRHDIPMDWIVTGHKVQRGSRRA
jgi:5,10-methenyltetrahydrofolate synthetase